MSHSILIIEDTDADFEAMVRTLRRLGVQNAIKRCEDADEALGFLYGRDRQPASGKAKDALPAIVLLDLTLNGSDGRELLARMKQDDYLRSIPIVVWSGSTDPNDVEISYRLGANSFVRKTFDFSEVHATLERLANFWLETAILPTNAEKHRPGA